VDIALATRLPLRVLLADDNVINQKVASRLLQQMGYKADIANNGLEVLQALERKPYDVILMDVQMPRMDGFEATRQIRLRQQQSPPPAHFNQTIVIIAMTASAMHGDREKCLAAGMNTYVPKPVRPEVLQAALEEFSARRPASSDSGVDAEAPPSLVVPGPAAASEPPVDLARLIEFSGGPGDSFTELVDLYLKQTAEQLGQIRLALGQKAASRVASIAHSCAGASATCGMSGMLTLLRQLERLATEGDLVSSGQLLPSIDAEFARIKAFLAQNTKLRSAA
jgi:CheY-like chemotaxis protein/HPt (histidine-containing phosphotransfer) domain-containing protein